MVITFDFDFKKKKSPQINNMLVGGHHTSKNLNRGNSLKTAMAERNKNSPKKERESIYEHVLSLVYYAELA